MLNPKEKEIIQFGSENGKSREEIRQAVVNFRTGIKRPEPVESFAEQPEESLNISQRAVGAGKGLLTGIKEGAKSVYQQITGLPEKLKEDVTAGAEDIQAGMEEGGIEGEKSLLKGAAKSGLRTAGDVAIAGLSPIGAIINAGVETAKGAFPELAEFTDESIKSTANYISDFGIVQDFATKHPNAGEDFERALILGMLAADPAARKGDIVESVKGGIEKTKAGIEGGIEAVKTGAETVKTGTQAVVEGISHPIQTIKNLSPKKAIETFKASDVVGKTQNYLSRKNTAENFESSVKRLEIEKPLEKYNRFFEQEQKFKADIKQDTAIGQVGSEIGNAYQKVVKMRSAVGEKMPIALEKIGDIKVNANPAITKFSDDLAGSGLETTKGKVKRTSTSKVSSQDVELLNRYIKELSELDIRPTVAEVDAFLSRVNAEIDVFKGKNNITKTTNGERIIKRNLSELRKSFSPEVNPAFKEYSDLRSDYSSYTGFLDEGASFLGKKTQSGDFAKDASLSKSAVQSILNQGKKDWLLVLEDLTGYQALDNSVLALQAMQDAGNFRGRSLLELMTEGSRVPTSAKDLTTRVVEGGLKKAGEKFVGEPVEQTRRVITEILNQKK